MIIKTDLGNGYVEIKSDKGVYIHGGFPEADYSVVIEPKTVDRKYIETDRPIPEPPKPPQPEPEPPKPVTNEQLQAEIAQLKEDNLALMMGVADLYSAVSAQGGGTNA